MFDTPILYLIFNRPDITRRTFEVIRQLKPRHLYVAADGPRSNHPTDIEHCLATRLIIEQNLDWPCELHTLFRDKNRGCGRGPAEAITWFFERVEAGIVLEDDCLPHPSFFPFCRTLLETYRYDEHVCMITGTNGLRKWGKQKNTYHFSYMAQSLGWASWRRSWQAFDYDMERWHSVDAKEAVRKLLSNNTYYRHYEVEFNKYQASQPDDVWDFQWLFARWLQGGKTAVPSVNLVKNIGFNADATHSFYEHDLLANIPLFGIEFPLQPPEKAIDKLFDWYLFERFTNQQKRTILKKIALKLIKVFTSSLV